MPRFRSRKARLNTVLEKLPLEIEVQRQRSRELKRQRELRTRKAIRECRILIQTGNRLMKQLDCAFGQRRRSGRGTRIVIEEFHSGAQIRLFLIRKEDFKPSSA